MLVKKLSECKNIMAADGCTLKEVLRPELDSTFVGAGFSLAHGFVKRGKKTKPHKLGSTETYCILKGNGRMHIDGESAEVCEEDVIFVPAGATQFIENIGQAQLVFFCIVSPSWSEKTEEVLE